MSINRTLIRKYANPISRNPINMSSSQIYNSSQTSCLKWFSILKWQINHLFVILINASIICKYEWNMSLNMPVRTSEQLSDSRKSSMRFIWQRRKNDERIQPSIHVLLKHYLTTTRLIGISYIFEGIMRPTSVQHAN